MFILCLNLWLGCAKHKAPNIAESDPSAYQVPEPEDFKLGKGDKIAIRVWRHPDLDMDITIAPDGTITYPLVGAITVEGLTYPELVQTLTAAIKDYYQDPQVSVNIIELNNQKVFVLGAGVATPSVLQLQSEMTVLEALTRSGGLSATARTNNVLLIRGGLEDPQLYKVNVASITNKGQMDQMIYLQRGDIVVVPQRTITSTAQYFRDISAILAPAVGGSAIYRNMRQQNGLGTNPNLNPAP